MNNQTYWIDLTDLITWKGIHTGIPRVIYNLAKEYAKNENARFFYFDNRKHKFFEVDFTIVIPPTPVKGVKPKKNIEHYRVHAIIKAKHYYGRAVSEETRRKLNPLLKPLLRKSYLASKSMKESFQDRLRMPTSRIEVSFKPDDVIVIMGAGWGKPEIIPALHKVKKLIPIKIVHFVHDLIPIYHPQFFGPGFPKAYTEYIFDALTITDIVITNSEASKKDIIKFCEEACMKQPPIIKVRLSDTIHIPENVKEPEGLDDRDFIMTVGTIEVRKNHRLLYQSYKLAKQNGVTLPKLIIVGRPGWLVEDLLFEIQNDPETQDDIVILNGIHDSQLAWLYENCLFTVYPSVYEGWGMPIAESLAYGKLCIASNTSSMTEIAGELIDYFSPYDPVGCLEAIKKYVKPDTRKSREVAILAGYKSQSWQTTFKEIQLGIENNLTTERR